MVLGQCCAKRRLGFGRLARSLLAGGRPEGLSRPGPRGAGGRGLRKLVALLAAGGLFVSGSSGLLALSAGTARAGGLPRSHLKLVEPRIVIGARPLGRISRYLFGANLLWAYDAEGAFDPASGSFYPGFVSLLRRLGISAIRYPGGTTSDSFDWLRAIGPEASRQDNEPYGMQSAKLSGICCVLDGPQPSTVGPDEFGQLLDQTGAAGTVTVNFDTGNAQQAADFVAYMTAPLTRHPSDDPAEPSYWAALRAKDGHPAPYDVPYWEVGNEQFFPGQYGWRSGQLVSIGPHQGKCPPGDLQACLYAFGGTTAFSDQPVGTFADDLPSASYSTGAPGQTFYVWFPPVVPGSLTVYVGGQPWSEVPSLSSVGPGAEVYTLSPATGAIHFGNGVHGEVPPAGAQVTASYESGPHDGFVEFYRAMKAMNPHVQVCESEGADVAFLRLMGRKYPYDCVQLHLYAKPSDVYAPLASYEEELMAFPIAEASTLAKLQREVLQYSGRHVPVLITEYGQLVAPVPAADPAFNLSLGEALLTGAQLIEWLDHGVPVAEKYLLDSEAPLPVHYVETAADRSLSQELALIDRAMVASGLSVESAMVVHDGPRFVAEPSGLVIGLMSQLAGAERLPSAVTPMPVVGTKAQAPGLWVAAGALPGKLVVAVVNANPSHAVGTRVVFEGLAHGQVAVSYLLDGPTLAAFNTPSRPGVVTTTRSVARVGNGNFYWVFPAHSVSLLVLRRPAGPSWPGGQPPLSSTPWPAGPGGESVQPAPA